MDPLYRVSNLSGNYCYGAADFYSVTSCGMDKDDDGSSLVSSCQTAGQATRKGKELIGSLVPEKKLLALLPGQGEGDSNRSNWTCPRYWEWPPAFTTDTDFCDVPSDTEIQPKGFCVRLEVPMVKKRTFPASKTFVVNPPSVTFRQDPTTGKWDEFAWIRVLNTGKISRRLNLIPPVNPAFTVDWGATLKEKTKVPPGLVVHIRIQFRPKSDEPICDELVIRVDRDGGLGVPIMASPQDPPLLEFEDWNCGCCLIGQKTTQTFRITNLGGIGRFWLLSEAEFMNEFSKDSCATPTPSIAPPPLIGDEEEEPGETEFPGELGTTENEEEQDGTLQPDTDGIPSPPDPVEVSVPNGSDVENPNLAEGNDESVGEGPIGEDENDEANPPPNTPHLEPSVVRRPGQLQVPQFRLAPAAFSLKGSESIKIKVSFIPSKPGFFHERVALLCDNGEVRWCSLKGLGFEPKNQRIITLHGENWDSDGPTTTLDLGDLSPEEPLTHKLRIRNSSSLPVYFFWVLEEEKQCPLSASEVYAQCLAKQSKFEGKTETECEEEPGEDCLPLPRIPFTITPNQGVLRACQEVDCTLDLVCPTPLGSYGSRVSLHIQQFSPESLRAMATMSRKEIQQEVKKQIKGQENLSRKPDPFSVHAYMSLPVFRIPPLSEEPMNELDIWLRCVPIQCFFEPSLLKYSGYTFTQAKRKLKFFNSTKHPVTLRLGDLESEFLNIAIEPKILHVPPQAELCLKVLLRFQMPGEVDSDLVGSLELPFKTVKVYLPTRCSSEAPPPCPEPDDGKLESDQPIAGDLESSPPIAEGKLESDQPIKKEDGAEGEESTEKKVLVEIDGKEEKD